MKSSGMFFVVLKFIWGRNGFATFTSPHLESKPAPLAADDEQTFHSVHSEILGAPGIFEVSAYRK